MTTHLVRCAGLSSAPFVMDCPDFSGAFTQVTVDAGDPVALIAPIESSVLSNVTLGTFEVDGSWNPADTPPAPGDLIVVVGPDEPFHQQGMVGVIRHDGTLAGVGVATLIAYDMMQNPAPEPPPEP